MSLTPLRSFADTLGHTFTDIGLLDDALTHPSVVGGRGKAHRSTRSNYERLEFLGDRVLGLVIADLLYQRFPDAPEGELSRRHAALVNRDTLTDIAITISLDKHLRIESGNVKDGQSLRRNLSALSDSLEAVIGALFIDGGLQAAEAFIRKMFNDIILQSVAVPQDPKTTLQEWAQQRGLALPKYTEIGRKGPDHAPVFLVEVAIEGLDPTSAEGTSRQIAQKAAATAMLDKIRER